MDFRDIAETARRQGFRMERIRDGWMFFPPDPSKRPVVWHGTPSDAAALRNFLSHMRRAGLEWPQKGSP